MIQDIPFFAILDRGFKFQPSLWTRFFYSHYANPMLMKSIVSPTFSSSDFSFAVCVLPLSKHDYGQLSCLLNCLTWPATKSFLWRRKVFAKNTLKSKIGWNPVPFHNQDEILVTQTKPFSPLLDSVEHRCEFFFVTKWISNAKFSRKNAFTYMT